MCHEGVGEFEPADSGGVVSRENPPYRTGKIGFAMTYEAKENES